MNVAGIGDKKKESDTMTFLIGSNAVMELGKSKFLGVILMPIGLKEIIKHPPMGIGSREDC